MDYSAVVTIEGRQPGKTVAIMGGVHGDEICGVQALERLIVEATMIETGRLFLIFGNPRAIERGVRQTEMNLNRAFRPEWMMSEAELKSYEYERAQAIKPYFVQCDALLDVHSALSEKTQHFIICEPHSFGIAQRLQFPIRSFGWGAVEPGGTDYFVNRCGGWGICVECGQHKDPEARLRARESIETFLVLMGLRAGKEPEPVPSQRTVQVYYAHMVKEGYVPARRFADFERLKPGEPIGADGAVRCHAPWRDDALILFADTPTQKGKEGYLLAREIAL